MKQKIVVASVSMLALACCPAFAGTYHAKHAQSTQQMTASHIDYKGMMPPVVVCPITDPYTMTLEAMDQNIGRAVPTEDCTKLIAFAGGANFDAKWGNRSMGYTGENTQRLALNDAYLNVFGNINDWSKAFVSLSYNDATPYGSGRMGGGYSSATPSSLASTSVSFEQGFIRLANFQNTPFFAQLGKQFQPFGRYTIHPITRSMTQVLSESLATSAEVGFVTGMGVHGAVFGYNNPVNQRNGVALTSTTRSTGGTVFGAELGWDHFSDQLGYDLGVGYLSNMTGVNDVAAAINTFNGGSYRDTVGAATAYGDLNTGPFSISLRYTSAVSKFNNNDLQTQTLAAAAAGTGKGAQPHAGDIQVGYGFNAWNKNQNLYAGYQASSNAAAIFLPQSRWLVGYGLEMWKSTLLGLEWDHDNSYSVSRGGSGDSSNVVSFRAGVKFG